MGFQATLILADEGMTAGLFYQFQARALNSQGYSEFSSVVTFPVADAPAKPDSAPQLRASSRTAITVEWETSASTQPPAGQTTGHLLYMDDG